MRIFRIVLLGLAMALFAINFWAIDYQDLWGKNSQWAYLRILAAFIIVIFVLRMVKRDIKNKERQDNFHFGKCFFKMKGSVRLLSGCLSVQWVDIHRDSCCSRFVAQIWLEIYYQEPCPMEKEESVQHFLDLIKQSRRGKFKVYIGMIEIGRAHV